MKLNPQETERYSRQILLTEIGEEGQCMLKNASVLVIGAGGLGCPVLQYLAAAGAGRIGMVDGDVVEISNLHRQILFSDEDLGRNKALTAKGKLAKLNPGISIQAFPEFLNPENAMQLLQPYDIIVDGSDNFSTRYLVNDACVKLSKPFVSGSVFRFEGQVGVFNFKNSATYRCLFPEPPLPQERPDCSEIGVLNVVPGTIGLLMADEVIKLITGFGEPLINRLLIVDFKKTQFRELHYQRDDDAVKKIMEQLLPSFAEYEVFCSGKKNGMPVKEISAEELQEWITSKKDFQLIDVREPAEREEFNIGGVHLPVNSLMKYSDAVETGKSVVFYCHSGMRSRFIVEYLQQKTARGNLYSLKGGVMNYAH